MQLAAVCCRLTSTDAVSRFMSVCLHQPLEHICLSSMLLPQSSTLCAQAPDQEPSTPCALQAAQQSTPGLPWSSQQQHIESHARQPVQQPTQQQEAALEAHSRQASHFGPRKSAGRAPSTPPSPTPAQPAQVSHGVALEELLCNNLLWRDLQRQEAALEAHLH